MRRVVTVVPEAGLHARPAAKFVETAGEFDAEVQVGRADEGDDGLVNAASMLGVTGLNVRRDEDVLIVAEGDDAEAALDALEAILSTPESGDGESEDA
ncbi:phosphocarrier protein HPr [Salinirubrum litoreum]|uniref:Phosphocarrier protein HPr n=1 Tax=Salinirubrum litoreum TaxID=1126234 RepID=A0ABD5R971_9EURY|nr:phosphocarrier protein HPr [Salinirubrum litoreum]